LKRREDTTLTTSFGPEGRPHGERRLLRRVRGHPARYVALARFFDRLRSAKAAADSDAAMDLGTVVRDPAWVDLLDADAFEAMCAPDGWPLEELLECILGGDRELVGLTVDGRAGRLV
jgi:hypothetical protein